MTKELEEKILDKLKLGKRSAYFILSNEILCERILNENPIRLNDFLKKHDNISSNYIIGLIKKSIISSFSNSENKGSATFIFENELENHIKKYNYNTNYLFYMIEKTVNLFLLNIKDTLSEREYNVLRALLVENKSREEVCNDYKISAERVRQIFEKSYYRVVSSNRINNDYNELKKKYDFLQSEYSELNKNILDSEKNANILLETELIDIDISVRALNSLKTAGITTLRELSLASAKNLMKYRNFGLTTLREVNSVLYRYNLKLKD
jgi:hypothetical protein